MPDINWGIWGGGIAVLFLIGLQAWLVRRARQNARTTGSNRVVKFWDLIVTGDDEKYSLSRFQLYLWFVVIVVSYTAVCFATGELLELSEGLNALLGINVAAAVASSAIALKDDKRQIPKAAAPDFVRDIFFESDASLDLPRTQMFAWTVIIALGYIAMVVKSFQVEAPHLPDVPLSLAALMGISHGAYLGAKAAEKK